MYQSMSNLFAQLLKYHRLCLVVILLSISIMSPDMIYAQEDANQQKAKELHDLGVKEYKAENWEKALQFFLEAYQIFPKDSLKMKIAFAHEKLHDYENAQSMLEAFLKTNTNPEKAEEAQNKIKEINEKLKNWTLVEIKSNPPGAEVFVDQSKKAKGKTPVTFKVPTQVPVKLTLRLNGYDALAHTAKYVKKEGVQTKTYQFKTKGAFVSFTSTQKGIKVLIDGKKEVKIPSVIELPLGEHKLEATLADHTTLKQSFNVEGKHTKKAPLALALKLEKSGILSKLKLNIDENGAQVYLDGQLQGNAPLEEISVKAGKYKLEVKGKMGEFSQEISLVEGESLNMDITLQKTSLITTKNVSTALVVTGATALVTGLVFTGLAFSSSGDLDDCRQNASCARGQGELDLSTDVKSQAFLADIFVVSGLLVGGTGAVLYLLNQKTSTAPNIQVTPTVGGAAIRAGFEF